MYHICRKSPDCSVVYWNINDMKLPIIASILIAVTFGYKLTITLKNEMPRDVAIGQGYYSDGWYSEQFARRFTLRVGKSVAINTNVMKNASMSFTFTANQVTTWLDIQKKGSDCRIRTRDPRKDMIYRDTSVINKWLREFQCDKGFELRIAEVEPPTRQRNRKSKGIGRKRKRNRKILNVKVGR